jgi:molybdopterin-containing oxidoreductase family iron-sulfur binding subunit
MHELERRAFLQLLGATLAAAGIGACREEDLAWVETAVREGESPRPDLLQAVRTATVREGYATSVLATHWRGRPIKIEGDPAHALSLGGSSATEQAALLSLYDPDRAAMVMRGAEPSTWGALKKELRARVPPSGQGLRILTGPSSSPTLGAQLRALTAARPQAKWHHWSPLARDNVWAGATLAFGEALEPLIDFSRTAVVLSLDADVFCGMPGALRAARHIAERRRATRLYAVQTAPRTFGAYADHCWALPPSGVVAVALALARRFGIGGSAATLPSWLEAVSRDLEEHRGACAVVVGDEQPPIVHAVAHHLNAALAARVRYLRPALLRTDDSAASLRELCGDLDRGEVRTLLIAECNPVYDAPADFRFTERLAKAPFSVALADRCDETAARCTWLVPAQHVFEQSGDARAADGTAAPLHPLIAPTRERKSITDLLGLFAPLAGPVSVAEQARREPALRALPDIASPPKLEWEIAFRADPTVADGREANNAWLQELAKPMLGVTWGNVILMSTQDAAREGIASGDIVRVALGDRALEGPALTHDVQATGALTLYLGGGRSGAGRVGNGVGYDAYPLRRSDARWSASGAVLHKTGRRVVLAQPQTHHEMEGRPIALTQTQLAQAAPVSQPSLYETPRYAGHAWAMSIDLDRCIGCRACTAACQAENNIPVVGKEQVIAGRAMQWIRVDEYAGIFQPVPCMHCENAPCEVVCPTGATSHDHEGLNQMVYNRCVGTRYCSNNCPYKVRRFNFFHYSAEQVWQARNPEVSVRGRGVMEKCTYCIQRIQRARMAAESAHREMRDGDVVTACAQACPTRAIVFGDGADGKSEVAQRRSDPRHYALLAELGTRPRTTYLAKVPNPNPEIA